MAHRIARICGVAYNFSLPLPVTLEEFDRHSTLLAFALNGQTDSQRALHAFTGLENGPIPKFNGVGGEIYRGHYYHHPQIWTMDLVRRQLMSLDRIKELTLRNSEIRQNFHSFLKRKITFLSESTRNPTKLMDLFYILERFGNWGAMLAQSTWNTIESSPFASSLGALYISQMNISYSDAPIHRMIIKQQIPQVYSEPINNNPFDRLPYYTKPYRNILYWGQKMYFGLSFKLHRYFGTKSQAIQENRSNYFATKLESYLKNLILENNSISQSIFKTEYLAQIIDSHCSRKTNHLSLLGKLVTIENWRKMRDTFRNQDRTKS